MRARITLLLSALVMLASGSGFAQSKEPKSDVVVARLSFDRTSVVWREHEGPSKVCIVLYRNGRYQLLRNTEKGTEFLEGELSPNQLRRVSTMLEGLDFQGGGANTVRQGSDSFEAEVHGSGKTMRYLWVDPDHQRPFPKSAIEVVNWLRNFKAEGASPLIFGEFSEQQVCPSETLLPLASELNQGLGASSCGSRPR